MRTRTPPSKGSKDTDGLVVEADKKEISSLPKLGIHSGVAFYMWSCLRSIPLFTGFNLCLFDVLPSCLRESMNKAS